MTLIKEFKKSKDDDYEHMSSITGAMRIVLKALKNGLIPHEQYSNKDLITFCKSLINSQEPDGSWPVHRPEDTIPEEDIVDFVFFPTQIACSILTHVKQNLKISELKGIEDAIARGLKFSISKNLDGYGYNSAFQRLESLIIFIEGSVPEYLNQDPRICPSLYDRLIELREEIQALVDSGNTKMEYGGDYKEQYQFVLAGFANI